jgi:hypothetical protein
LIRPAIPVLDYLVNFDYIAEVLCLKKEVPRVAVMESAT